MRGGVELDAGEDVLDHEHEQGEVSGRLARDVALDHRAEGVGGDEGQKESQKPGNLLNKI